MPDNLIRLDIFNINGELVYYLEEKDIIQSGQVRELRWDITNRWHRKVASGVYIYYLKTKLGGYV